MMRSSRWLVGLCLAFASWAQAVTEVQIAPTVESIATRSAQVRFDLTFPSQLMGLSLPYYYVVCKANYHTTVPPVDAGNSVCTFSAPQQITVPNPVTARLTWTQNDLVPNTVYSVSVAFPATPLVPDIQGVMTSEAPFNTTPDQIVPAPSNLPPDFSLPLFTRTTSMVGYWTDATNPLGFRTGDICTTRYEMQACPAVPGADSCHASYPCSSNTFDQRQQASIDNGLIPGTEYVVRARALNFSIGNSAIRTADHGPWVSLGQIRTKPAGTIRFLSSGPDSGYNLDTVDVCVPRTDNYRFTFDRTIGQIDYSKIKLYRDAYVVGGNPIELMGVDKVLRGDQLVLVPPRDGGWPANTPIRIEIQPRAVGDGFGEYYEQSLIRTFVAQGQLSDTTPLRSFYDGNTGLSELIQAPSSPVDTSCIVLRTQFVQPREASVAGVPLAAAVTPDLQPLGQKVEVVRVVGHNPQATAPIQTLLRIPLRGLPGGTDPNATRRFVIALFDPVSKALLPVETQLVNGYLQASIRQTGAYFVARAQTSPSLSNLVVFPNPYKPNLSLNDGIHFRALGGGSRVRIYTLSGQLVQDQTIDDGSADYIWNLRNRSGESVASGVYLYTVETSTDKKQGKLMVIR